MMSIGLTLQIQQQFQEADRLEAQEQRLEDPSQVEFEEMPLEEGNRRCCCSRQQLVGVSATALGALAAGVAAVKIIGQESSEAGTTIAAIAGIMGVIGGAAIPIEAESHEPPPLKHLAIKALATVAATQVITEGFPHLGIGITAIAAIIAIEEPENGTLIKAIAEGLGFGTTLGLMHTAFVTNKSFQSMLEFIAAGFIGKSAFQATQTVRLF